MKEKYTTSGLSKAEKNQKLHELITVMKKNKPYLNPELTLDSLSATVSLNPNQLSQIINELLNKNFYQLINEYRVEEVKSQIFDDSRSLLGIALDCGFNSKSSFNRTFKEITGKTPSAYRKVMLK